MEDTTVEIDARIARNLKNGIDSLARENPTVAREIRRSVDAIDTDSFGMVEVPAYELTWVVAEAEGSNLVARAAVSQATAALEEAGVW